ncbi:hypothetical protein AB0M47_38830 [Hamadaea sp. NPDC051192]|uniref:hypothetical protein n=1 Tax=Hamadaea sp. NPDC051192 TaxID=3154940 RepID=UPI00344002D6
MRTSTMLAAIRRALKIAAVTTVTVAGTCAALSAQPAVAKPADQVSAKTRVANAVKAWDAQHPHDYVGLNREIVKAGGDPVRFNFDKVGLANLTPEQAQAAYDNASRQFAAGEIGIESISSFNVSGYWSHVVDTYGEWWSWYGSWDFTTNESTGNPTDAMAVQTRDISSSCWKMDGDDGWLYNAGGGLNSSLFDRRFSDFDSAVWNINDSWGQTYYVDHGTLYISYKRLGCGSTVIYGKTFLEHNKSGCNCSWNFSITANVFSISYTGSDLPESYQKSTTLTSTWT